MADWTSHAREALQQGPAALVTILATEGSAPRGPGARMVVTETGLAGTIGGGALEHQAMAQARAILALAPGSWRVQDYPLGPLLGQCCGGRVRLLVEHLDERARWRRPVRSHPVRSASSAGCSPGGCAAGLDAARGARCPPPAPASSSPSKRDRLPVCLFGAGHVGRAIAARAAGLPLHLAWYDSRPEAAETPGVVLADEDAMVACAAAAPEGAAVVILTHDHGARLSPHRRRARRPRALRRADRLARPSAPASSRGSRPTASTPRA